MPQGKSNRVVVDLMISDKRDLYAALAKDGLTLKEWFIANMERYLKQRRQLPLFQEGSAQK